MTHEQRAERIIEEWARQHSAVLGFLDRAVLVDSVSCGMAEASNAELERRRAAEAERDKLRAMLHLITGYSA